MSMMTSSVAASMPLTLPLTELKTMQGYLPDGPGVLPKCTEADTCSTGT